MQRRKFLGLLGGAAALAPIAVRAQQAGRTYRLGFLIPLGRQAPAVTAFFDELSGAGFIEGRNLEVIPDGFDVRNDRIPERIDQLVKAAPDVVVSAGILATRALQQATRTIPIAAMSEDMLVDGLVDLLARPGGNTTGTSLMSPDLDGKRQDILIEIVPKARRIAALFDSRITTQQHTAGLQTAAQARGIALSVFGAAVAAEIPAAIGAAKDAGAEAINFLATPLYSVNSAVVFERVAALRLPSIYQWPDMGEDGGLAAYGPRFTEIFRQRAKLVIKMLRGAKPADIPVEQPTRFELVINLKTAKAIGHEIPAGLVLRADKLVE